HLAYVPDAQIEGDTGDVGSRVTDVDAHDLGVGRTHDGHGSVRGVGCGEGSVVQRESLLILGEGRIHGGIRVKIQHAPGECTLLGGIDATYLHGHAVSAPHHCTYAAIADRCSPYGRRDGLIVDNVVLG